MATNKTPTQQPFIEMAKADAQETAYRIGAAKLVKAVKLAVLEGMKKDKSRKKGQLTQIESFLDSELGEAVISLVLGVALDNLPMLKDDPRASRMAKEFRTASMAKVGNEILDKLMDQLLPAVQQTWANLPMNSEKEQEVVVLQTANSNVSN